MYLKKVCIFLAAAFFVLDLMFFLMYMSMRNNMQKISGEMIDNAVAYFDKNGVAVNASVIPDKVPDNPIYSFASYDEDLYEAVSEKISSEYYPLCQSLSAIETPDGIVYSVSDDSSAKAHIRFYSDSFAFEYSTEEYEESGIGPLGSDKFETDSKEISDKDKKALERFIGTVSYAKNQSYDIVGVSLKDTGVYISVTQNAYGNYPIEDNYANILISDGTVKYACGKWISREYKKSYSEPLTDGVNALKNMDISDAAAILSEKIVYRHRYAGNDTNYLIPVWEIVYLDNGGSVNTQYIDAIKDQIVNK